MRARWAVEAPGQPRASGRPGRAPLGTTGEGRQRGPGAHASPGRGRKRRPRLGVEHSSAPLAPTRAPGSRCEAGPEPASGTKCRPKNPSPTCELRSEALTLAISRIDLLRHCPQLPPLRLFPSAWRAVPGRLLLSWETQALAKRKGSAPETGAVSCEIFGLLGETAGIMASTLTDWRDM